jgi:hypothetical protein
MVALVPAGLPITFSRGIVSLAILVLKGYPLGLILGMIISAATKIWFAAHQRGTSPRNSEFRGWRCPERATASRWLSGFHLVTEAH